MKHIIYKTTNKVNGRYYIGRHSTDNLNDGYLGSGQGIKNAINKYGKENFTREIIATAETTDDLWELEKEIVNEEIVKDSKSYNQAYGGGNWLHELKKQDPDAHIAHQRRAGLAFAKVYHKYKKNTDWHKKGGHASSNAKQKYKLTSPDGNVKILGYNELVNECKNNDWSFNSVYWQARRNNVVTQGKAQGVRIEVI